MQNNMRRKIGIGLVVLAGLFIFFVYSLFQLKHELETNKKMNEEEKSRYEEMVKDIEDQVIKNEGKG
mgnify:CR=1 FL=1